uniref:Uncharacterized protein n=1 Tax=Arundo donax TaxID=35708 RepID=A0A0A9CLJ0_ARUDO
MPFADDSGVRGAPFVDQDGNADACCWL